MKRFVAAALAATMLTSLTACGGSGSNTVQTTAAPAQTEAALPKADSGSTSGGDEYTAENPMVLRLAGQSGLETLIHYACVDFCDRVKDRTDGKLVIEFYPNNQLGDYTQVFEEIIMGTVDMGIISPNDAIDPLTLAYNVPGLSATYDGVAEICGEGGYMYDVAKGAIEKLGMKVLGLYFNGMMGIATSKPLKEPADPSVDKGIIIRSPALATMQLACESIGFRTSALPFSEIFSSMQTGVVDGYYGGMPHTALKSFPEVVKYYYDYNLGAEFLPITISNKTWEKLPEEWQTIIQEEAKKTCEDSFVNCKDYEDQCLEDLAADGKEIITFTDEERANYLQGVRDNCWPKLEEVYGKEFFDGLREAVK